MNKLNQEIEITELVEGAEVEAVPTDDKSRKIMFHKDQKQINAKHSRSKGAAKMKYS